MWGILSVAVRQCGHGQIAAGEMNLAVGWRLSPLAWWSRVLPKVKDRQDFCPSWSFPSPAFSPATFIALYHLPTSTSHPIKGHYCSAAHEVLACDLLIIPQIAAVHDSSHHTRADIRENRSLPPAARNSPSQTLRHENRENLRLRSTSKSSSPARASKPCPSLQILAPHTRRDTLASRMPG